MRTLIDIQDDLMHELMKEVGSKTKKEAVITAIKTYLNTKKRERLKSLIGNFEFGYTADDLDRMRADG